jgi:hypothetical protein
MWIIFPDFYRRKFPDVTSPGQSFQMIFSIRFIVLRSSDFQNLHNWRISIWPSLKMCFGSHHAEVVFNPNPMNQKMVTDFGNPRDSEKCWMKIGYGSFLYQLFSKRDFYNIKCGWNWQKITIFDYVRCRNVSYVFHDLKNVKIAQKSLKINQFWLYFMNLNHIFYWYSKEP